jgi:hypothetical protein
MKSKVKSGCHGSYVQLNVLNESKMKWGGGACDPFNFCFCFFGNTIASPPSQPFDGSFIQLNVLNESKVKLGSGSYHPFKFLFCFVV